MSEIINETINELNKPTQNNVFSIGDNPVTVLEKMNQIERYLKQIDNSVDTSINTANEALEKANNAFEANGTLVKINGENQLTWSADFAESERQKSNTDGAIVHKNDIEPILIYDIDTKNTIGGTAYTNGIKFGASININVAGYSKIKVYSKVYNTYNITEVVIDKVGWTGNSFMIFGEASAIKNVGMLIYHDGQNITPAECFNFSDNTTLNNNDNAYVYRIEEVK
jgi:hypothetical protein